ncbi:MAG: DUF1465 family protein [Holosporales bacterium]|jgi:hypothetical protein|nr:DUF1465 family protein [Holosporales bacterium]
MNWQLFFDKIFEDVLSLMEEVYDYIKWQEPIDSMLMKRDSERDCLNCETAKMSVCLIRIMAWLMARRAVMAGEMQRKCAGKYMGERPLTFLVEYASIPKFMPKQVLLLSRKVLNMYKRINRLSKIAIAVEKVC